jgi:glycosyltransferase involved in cell wall biosynthesis
MTDGGPSRGGAVHDARKVLVCGNYGIGIADGQSIKTRTLKDALVKAYGPDAVTILDTSSVFRHPLAFYLSAKRQFAQSTSVIILPGPRALHVVLPLFLRWNKSGRRDIRYVVIGGWLPGLLESHARLQRQCARLDGIYVEAEMMVEKMRGVGLHNVHHLPNFRTFDLEMARNYSPVQVPLKLVFCARIFKEKGIGEAIDAVNRLNRGRAEPLVTLDIYGSVEAPYQQFFDAQLRASTWATYKGVLTAENLYPVLQTYDLMLFPTYYSDEGFPGTIVDAFIAGVPVLASDWKYNRELVADGETGAFCRTHSVDSLAETIKRYVDAPRRLTAMRARCIEEARKYHSDVALTGLLQDLDASAGREQSVGRSSGDGRLKVLDGVAASPRRTGSAERSI